jgi:hypothetical protein
MKTAQMHHPSDAPDLLKRFVPLPFEGVFAASGLDILVQTNRRQILDLAAESLAQPRRTGKAFRWKLIHDSGAPSEIGKPTIIKCGRLAVATFGTACLIGVDYGRSELVAFIGLDAQAPKFRDVVLPFLIELTSIDTSVKLTSPDNKFAVAGLYE